MDDERRAAWAEAKKAYEERAAGALECSGIVGVSTRRIHQVAERDGWKRNDAAVAALDEERRRASQAMRAASERKWANRRDIEADAAGLTAAKMRQAALEASDQGLDRLLKARTIAYAIFIDKAQLLSGAATQRIGAEDPRERAQGILDELAAKRDEKRTGTDG